MTCYFTCYIKNVCGFISRIVQLVSSFIHSFIHCLNGDADLDSLVICPTPQCLWWQGVLLRFFFRILYSLLSSIESSFPFSGCMPFWQYLHFISTSAFAIVLSISNITCFGFLCMTYDIKSNVLSLCQFSTVTHIYLWWTMWNSAHIGFHGTYQRNQNSRVSGPTLKQMDS